TRDVVRRPGIQNGHAGCPLEERIQRGVAVGGRWRPDTGQPLLDRTLRRGFDILSGQTGKFLRELIKPGGTNVHGPPIWFEMGLAVGDDVDVASADARTIVISKSDDKSDFIARLRSLQKPKPAGFVWNRDDANTR
ncbi:MAG: hypothetical protein Q7U92_21595, partial [Bradyrhizobium sp.]|nr:hypothetical protein [Bradyrhizobium sp.]